MKDVNKVFLIGRLGADPIQRETKNGVAVVHFPLATTRRIQVAAGNPGQTGSESPNLMEETQWHRIVTWGKQGETCAQFLKKGASVYIEGSMRSHKYEGKDGQSRMAFEVHAEEVSFLGKSKTKSTSDEAIAVVSA